MSASSVLGTASTEIHNSVHQRRRPAAGRASFAQNSESSAVYDLILKARGQGPRAFTVTALAAAARMSRMEFRRQVLRTTGFRPTKYIRVLQVYAAAHRLVSSQDSVEAVALESGFRDEEQFSRLFITLLGMTPADFRQP